MNICVLVSIILGVIIPCGSLTCYKCMSRTMLRDGLCEKGGSTLQFYNCSENQKCFIYTNSYRLEAFIERGCGITGQLDDIMKSEHGLQVCEEDFCNDKSVKIPLIISQTNLFNSAQIPLPHFIFNLLLMFILI